MQFLKKLSVAAVSSILTTGVVQAAEPTPEDWFNAGRQTVIDAKTFESERKTCKKCHFVYRRRHGRFHHHRVTDLRRPTKRRTWGRKFLEL